MNVNTRGNTYQIPPLAPTAAARVMLLSALFPCRVSPIRGASSPIRGASSLRGGSTVMRDNISSLRDRIAHEPAKHPAFRLPEAPDTVDEYGLGIARYLHLKSGAEVLSVQAADDNKVFCITFGTPVADSTGVPHILEHSVLCG